MKQFIQNYFSAPNDALMQVALGGEKVAAHLRLYVLGLLWISSIILCFFLDDIPFELVIGICAGTIAFCSALIVLYLSKKPTRNTLRHFLICAFDITLISSTLIFFALVGKPEVAINSMVVWELYLIFILATGVYFDTRITISISFLALLQYLFILLWVNHNWDMANYNPSQSNLFTGISWYVQLARLALIFIAGLITVGIVIRSRKLLMLSGTDTLTSLENRRVFEVRLEQEIARAARENSTFCVGFIDIDHFKKFNDDWGHASGDKVLVIFATVLKQYLRKEDIMSRWGGEEFIILFPNTDKQTAHTLLERIKTKMSENPLPISNNEVRIYFSAGISEFPSEQQEASPLIDLADSRLQLAKLAGRNQIIINS